MPRTLLVADDALIIRQNGVLKHAFKAGAADFVSKPFDKENLQATLAQLLPESRCQETG